MSTLFIELGYKLINSEGTVNYITSNQFLSTEYGRKMREFFVEKQAVRQIVDFGDLRVFENAMTYVSIFFVAKRKNSKFRK